MKFPSLSYIEIVNALKRMGWVVVRQKGSHIRLQKGAFGQRLKLTVRGAQTCSAYNLKVDTQSG